jgi:hypothetical protein
MNEDDLKNTLGEGKNVHFINASELKTSSSAADLLSKKEYWKHFIIAALLLLLAEVLVIRFWKN